MANDSQNTGPGQIDAGQTDLEDDDDIAAMRTRIAGTNINAQTLLATDYLNHFNEIAMLLEMVPDMNDMLDEAKAWQPKS
jgi:hypothetical protein